MNSKFAVIILISLVAVASGCVGSNDSSPEENRDELMEEAQDQTQEESETLQSCSSIALEISMMEKQVVVQQTAGPEAAGEVELDIRTSSGETITETVNIERSVGAAGVSVSGEVESATATPVKCPGAEPATYP